MGRGLVVGLHFSLSLSLSTPPPLHPLLRPLTLPCWPGVLLLLPSAAARTAYRRTARSGRGVDDGRARIWVGGVSVLSVWHARGV